MPKSKITPQEVIKGLKRGQEERRAEIFAAQLKLPYINLYLAPITVDTVSIVSEEESRAANLAVFLKSGRKLHVGVSDPENPLAKQIIDDLKNRDFEIAVFIVSKGSLEKAWQRYKDYVAPSHTLTGVLFVEEKDLQDFKEDIKNIEALKNKIGKVSITDLLNTVVAGALASDSSDIHFEPQPDSIVLRYRIDGVLQNAAELSNSAYADLLNRIKILSGLKLNVKTAAQDGRFSIRINRLKELIRELDVRVSVLPGAENETVVMRLLGLDVEKINLTGLGMRPPIFEFIKGEISKPNGMILATGPTGSGKTTTLYSALQYINKPEIKIITLEDPIEIKLAGISQTQVNAKKGYTFSLGLRALLRQDPDVVLVGEIRDEDTAKTAVNASLTGHLVFSTLHTNDASGTIPRLRDLGVDKTVLPGALNAVIAQRIVRKLCPTCKEAGPIPENVKEGFKKALSLISPRAGIPVPENFDTYYTARGCDDCLGLGYKGRLAIFEVMGVGDEIEKLILKDATAYELRARAMEEGMITLLQDGILRVLEGITSLEELERVAGSALYLEQLYGSAVSSLLSRSLHVREASYNFFSQSAAQKDIEEKLRSVPYEELLEWIVAGASVRRATDIHIEPREKDFVVRLRIDQTLQNLAVLPKGNFLPLVAEVKILSGLKTEIHKTVQEGRFNVDLGHEVFDTRVSVIPGGYGETIVIRLLKAGVGEIGLEELGIRPSYLGKISSEIKKPNGIILVTGPTGSGKTTTLYSVLSRLNKPGVKIITVEDPIEYRLEGILQTQVSPENDYTFARALPALLRQNPNIMMIGEIRDKDTATAAIQASLTGHLVFSTLHTNNSTDSIQRLLNLGVGLPDILSSFNTVIAQRLVRVLCDKCKKPRKPKADETKTITSVVENFPPDSGAIVSEKKSWRVYEPVGCAECGSTGYRGQIGIFEIFIVDDVQKENIRRDQNSIGIRKNAIKRGMMTMKQDGILKVLDGVTTLEEVERVTGGEE